MSILITISIDYILCILLNHVHTLTIHCRWNGNHTSSLRTQSEAWHQTLGMTVVGSLLPTWTPNWIHQTATHTLRIRGCFAKWFPDFWMQSSRQRSKQFCKLSTVPDGSKHFKTVWGWHQVDVVFLAFATAHDINICFSMFFQCPKFGIGYYWILGWGWLSGMGPGDVLSRPLPHNPSKNTITNHLHSPSDFTQNKQSSKISGR